MGDKAMIDIYKGNFQALILTVIFGTSLLGWQRHASESARVAKEQAIIAEPADNWFEVKNISIPNFIDGDDPNIIYDRVIKKPFSATWNVEVHRAGEAEDFAYCTGSGTNFYEPKEVLPDSGVTLSWFIGKKCNLPSGQYTIESHWEIRPEGYPTKEESYTSNLFRVLPKGSQLFITPEQSQKLEELPAP